MQEPSAPTKRMAEILGAQFVPKETNPTQPSQAAREDELVAILDDVERALKTKGIHGRHFALNALREHFARFERDTEKRVRESLAERTVPVAWLHTLHMEGGQNYTRLLENDGRDEDEPERTAFGLPGRDYSEEYTVTSEPLYRAARESIAGEANGKLEAVMQSAVLSSTEHRYDCQQAGEAGEANVERVATSEACIGEKCWCGAPAAKKVGEEILFDDPMPHRHNLTAYVCAAHYAQMMGPLGAKQVDLATLERTIDAG